MEWTTDIKENVKLIYEEKIFSGILALAVMISCSNGISVSAETLQSTPENIISENDGQMKSQ